MQQEQTIQELMQRLLDRMDAMIAKLDQEIQQQENIVASDIKRGI